METEVGNLFGKAVEAEKPKAASKSKDYHEIVLKESDYPNIGNHLVNLTKVREEMATAKSAEGKYALIVKNVAQREYAKLYQSTGVNPKTFVIRGEFEGALMVLPTDKYAGAVDEPRAEHLIREYGQDIITEKEEYFFSNAVINKEGNMAKISKAIIESDLSEEDKANLIGVRTSKSITKGAIDRMGNYDVAEAIQLLNPVFQLKNYK